MNLFICVLLSTAASIITTKILAAYYFEIVDGYVKDVCDEAKKNMKAMIHKD